MKLTKCDICGSLEDGGFFHIELPEMAGICSMGLRAYDVCPKCSVDIAVKVRELKAKARVKAERYKEESE